MFRQTQGEKVQQRRTTLGWLTALALLPTGVMANGSGRAKNRQPATDKGPSETRAERDRRLQRECRGKPNAGACEGYAH
jgi:hypothetical protein